MPGNRRLVASLLALAICLAVIAAVTFRIEYTFIPRSQIGLGADDDDWCPGDTREGRYLVSMFRKDNARVGESKALYRKDGSISIRPVRLTIEITSLFNLPDPENRKSSAAKIINVITPNVPELFKGDLITIIYGRCLRTARIWETGVVEGSVSIKGGKVTFFPDVPPPPRQPDDRLH